MYIAILYLRTWIAMYLILYKKDSVQLTESFFDFQLSMPAPDQKQVSQESFMNNYINYLYACIN